MSPLKIQPGDFVVLRKRGFWAATKFRVARVKSQSGWKIFFDGDEPSVPVEAVMMVATSADIAKAQADKMNAAILLYEATTKQSQLTLAAALNEACGRQAFRIQPDHKAGE